MRAAAIVVAALAVLLVGWWLWRYAPDPVRTRAATPPSTAAGSAAVPGVAGAGSDHRVRRLSADERTQTALRIADARKQHAATAPPRLPEGSASADDTMATAQQVLVQLQAVTDDIRADVTECGKLAPEVKALQTQITLTGDPDIGTLIDAPSPGTGYDGKPLPAAFDSCVRGVLESLELPPMKTGDQFTAQFEITM